MNDIEYDAELSECGEYRYRLSRIWDEAKKPLTFIMLNPSTADAELDDPTIRRCMGFAEREQAGGVVVVNLYGFRATKPFDLFQATDPIGPGNDRALKRAARQAKSIVCAWGAHARHRTAWPTSVPCSTNTASRASAPPSTARAETSAVPAPRPTTGALPTMSQELNQLKAQRLMLIGALSEDPDTKALVDEAYAELNEVAKKHEDAGMLAVALLTLDVAIKNSET